MKKSSHLRQRVKNKLNEFFIGTAGSSPHLVPLLLGLLAVVRGSLPDEPRRRKLAAVVVAAVLAAAGLAVVAVWPREASAEIGGSQDNWVVEPKDMPLDSGNSNGSAFGAQLGGTDNVVYNQTAGEAYVFYFDEASLEQNTSVCCKRLWLNNNTWDTKFEFNNSLYTVGEQWNDDEYYEGHISLNAHLDNDGYIWLVYGGHTSDASGWHIGSVRSTYAIDDASFDYKSAASWDNPVNLTTLKDDSSYETSYVDPDDNTYATLLRNGTSDNEMTVCWSTDNGSTWNYRDLCSEFYGDWHWRYDPDTNSDMLFMYPRKSKGTTWDGSPSFFWTTLDDIINNNGAYTSENTTSDSCYYSFPVAPGDIVAEDQLDDDYPGVVAFNPDDDKIYIQNSSGTTYDETGALTSIGVALKSKTLGTTGWTWTILKDESGWRPHDMEYTNGKLYMLATQNDSCTLYPMRGYSSTPTNNTSWTWGNVTEGFTCSEASIADIGPLKCWHASSIKGIDDKMFYLLQSMYHDIGTGDEDARTSSGSTYNESFVFYEDTSTATSSVSLSGLTSNRLTWAGQAGETVWSNSSGSGSETLNISINPSTDILQVDVGFGASNNSNVSTANMTLYASTSETGTYHSMGTFPDGGGNISINTRDTWDSDPFPVSSQDYIYCRLKVDIPPDASASTSGNITDCKVYLYG